MFLDKEYSYEGFQTWLAVPHFSEVVAKEQKAETLIRRCSVKKGLLEISHKIHRKTPVSESLFLALRLQLY